LRSSLGNTRAIPERSAKAAAERTDRTRPTTLF
jgi:hypothetical protein